MRNQIKLKSIKSNTNKGSYNLIKVKCQLSGDNIYSPADAICLNIKSNNTAYISRDYLEHQVFGGLKLSDSFKIDMLTLVKLGAALYNDELKLSVNNNEDLPVNYIINFDNGLQLLLYGSDAQCKKYFNILSKYKAQYTAEFYNNGWIVVDMSEYIVNNKSMRLYPPYAKKLYNYYHGIGYNPDSKASVVKYY